jgi:predicted transcriptional regulator
MKNKSRTLALAADNSSDASNPSINQDVLLAATAQIVSAYIANRGNENLNLTALTSDVYATLRSLASTDAAQSSAAPSSGSNRKPVVSVEESVKADYLVCLEDGKRVKMLKRHLKTAYGMSPEQYRARWDLPATYPMVAPNYAQVRSNLAKQIGLGRRSSLSAAKARMNAAAVNLR